MLMPGGGTWKRVRTFARAGAQNLGGGRALGGVRVVPLT